MKYEKRITIGRDLAGKPIRKRFYGNTKAELERNIFEYKKEAEKITNSENPTFKEYIDKWLAINEPVWAVATYQSYKVNIGMFASLFPKELKKIKESDLQSAISEHSGSPRSCQIARLALSMVYETAIRDGLVNANLAKHLKLPKYKAKEKQAFTDSERKAVLCAPLNDKDRLLVDILYSFGLRPAEAFALMPQDFDWKNKKLKIKKALDPAGSIKSTKTGAVREIPIPDKFIQEHKVHISQNKSLYLFSRENNQLPNKNACMAVQRRILGIISAYMNGTSDIKATSMTFYSFRHDYASRLYLYGVKERIISTKRAAAWLGHSEILFLKTYSHLLEDEENIQDLMQKIST